MTETLDINEFTRLVENCGALVFSGPYTNHVAGHRYVTLTSYGPKEEGASLYGPADEPTIWTAAEAIYRFKKVLREYIGDCDGAQFAWRRNPSFSETDHGDCCVTARCVLIREDATNGE